jgi:hypothetical protein
MNMNMGLSWPVPRKYAGIRMMGLGSITKPSIRMVIQSWDHTDKLQDS